MVARITRIESAGYWHLLMGKLRRLTVRGASGQILGVAPAIAVDADRNRRAAERYIRGLFTHIHGRRLALDAVIDVQVDPDAVNSQQVEIEKLLTGSTAMIVQNGVFWFANKTTADNPKVSLWLLIFFDEYAILAVVSEP